MAGLRRKQAAAGRAGARAGNAATISAIGKACFTAG
jgi:hypothetical protein